MDESIQVFNHACEDDVRLFRNVEFGQLHVIEKDGEPWFVARDVCGSLGVDRTATRRLDEDEKGVCSMRTPGGEQSLSIVSFPGLLSLVLGSRKPEAKAYKRWVTHEVLPAIHKTGGYMAAAPDETPEQTMARALLMADETIRRQRAQLDEAQPKAVLCDAMLLPSRETYTVSEAARYLANVIPSVKRQDVFDALRSSGMMCKGSTAPTRRAIAAGRMVAVASEYRDPDTGEERAGRQRGRLTPKGVGWLTCVLGGGCA